MSIGRYYKEINLINTEFSDAPTVKFDSIVSKFIIVLDSLTNDIEWSFNGQNIDGKMEWSDEKIIFGGDTVSKIWFKANVETGTKIRVWARL